MNEANYVAAVESARHDWNEDVRRELKTIVARFAELGLADFKYGWLVRGYSQETAFRETELHLRKFLGDAADEAYRQMTVEIARRRATPEGTI